MSQLQHFFLWGAIGLCLIFGPLVIIWCVNTLFQAGVPYAPETWLATLLLSSLAFGRRGKP